MAGFSFSRRRRNPAGWEGTHGHPAGDSSWSGDPVDGQFSHASPAGGPRLSPFDMAPAPDRFQVMERVKDLTTDLRGGIDEGTGASLDRLIESWTASWIAAVKSEAIDRRKEISIERGHATQRLTEARVAAEYEGEKLAEYRFDLYASRRRLTGESYRPARPIGYDQDSWGEPLALEAAPDAHGPERPNRQDWSEPHLIAGRSMWTVVLGGVLILIGAMADTIAFHNTLELVLTTETAIVAWVMATGTTCMALVAASSLGVARAIRRRGRYLPPRYRPSRFPLVLSSVVWLGLGVAMFVIRWLGQNVGGSLTLSLGGSSASGHSHYTLWQAIFFAAIYLVSGTCTLIESERIYNPEFFAFRRLRKQYDKQVQEVARADAARDQAEAEVERQDEELEREDQRRNAAIADRQSLGAQAENYARILMATIMRDPAKTGVTETGPIPDMSTVFGGGTAPATDAGSGANAGPAPNGSTGAI
jgi:hypothetical protein